MLAAINGNSIEIYSTTTFENICTLKAHSNKVQSVNWSDNDTSLVSCGSDGAVYEWDFATAKRISENVVKQCVYNDVAMSKDGRSIFAIGSDFTLKEIVDSQVCLETVLI